MPIQAHRRTPLFIGDFGDGTNAITAAPSHIYSSAGTYAVKLKVSYGGCVDSVVHSLVVGASANAAFSAASRYSCTAPFAVSFTNSSVGGTTFQWDFGDGSTSASTNTTLSHTYNTAGSFSVRLIATSSSGCSDTLLQTAYVVIQPIVLSISGGFPMGCPPATGAYTAVYTGPTALSSILWDFGDGGTGAGSTVSHSYASSGSYTITLRVTNTIGCVDSSTTAIIVASKPTSSFTASPDSVCLGNSIGFTSTSSGTITNYSYDFGDGSTASTANSSHVFGGPGTFNVRLIVSANGCDDTFFHAVTVKLPLAAFNYSYPCGNRKQITFVNNSIGASTSSWDFGDGTTSSLTNPGTHTYAANGIYTVTLTVTNTTTGCSHTTVSVISIYDLSAAFLVSDSNICRNGVVYFTASNSLYVSYAWDFGDGTTSSLINVYKAYPVSGMYTIKLVVTDSTGCKDSVTKSNFIKVRGSAVAFSNTSSSGCGPLSVTFTDASTPYVSSLIQSRLWIFGDGTSVSTSATSITHTYLAAGVYSVSLIVTDTSGCTDTLVKPNLITVSRPVAAFGGYSLNACINLPVSFINQSLGNPPLSYLWSFGDGGTSTILNPFHAYTSTGVYIVRLIATDGYGCKDTATTTTNNSVTVTTVTSSFTMSGATAYCPPYTVQFTNTSMNAVSYSWLFGNGNSTNLTNPSATYTATGTYTVRLIATNLSGCSDTSYQSIVINASPSGTLSYSPFSGCPPLTITFTATTTGSASNTLTYDFDNGVTLTTTAGSVSYTYTQPGIYIPKLIVTNAGGCTTSVLGGDTIKIEKVTAGFTVAPNPACTGSSITFTDTSSSTTSTIATRSWVFGDGDTASTATPSHTYTTSGTYNVRLVVTSANGCTDTTYRTVVINAAPVIIGANKSTCSGIPVQLSVSGAASYSWSPIAGLSCTACPNPVANPGMTTSYVVTGTSIAGMFCNGHNCSHSQS